MILSLDTTSAFGSIALTDAGATVAEVRLHAPEGFGHVLFGQIGQMLDTAGIAVKDIDCFAATSGPGSFTGVRVGLTAVKGLAEAAGRPVIAVSNLQALAFFGAAALRATVLDARRGEVYGAVYGRDLKIVLPEVVMSFGAWMETLPTADLEFVAIDFGPFQPFANPAIPVITAPPVLARAVGRIAEDRYRTGGASDPAAIDANYVRRSDAELFWKE